MHSVSLGLALQPSFAATCEEQLSLLRQTGFSSFFIYWDDKGSSVHSLQALARQLGLVFSSVHAPGGHMRAFWQEGAASDDALRELTLCLDDCIQNEIPVMVMHAMAGFDNPGPGACGLRHFEALLRRAEGTDTIIAVENLQCEAYHRAFLRHFKGHPNLGFCWDSGHELAYRLSDQLAEFGDQLVYVHLHDNLGPRCENGALSPRDDLHMLPFDGVGDWAAYASALARTPYRGPLMFELKLSPGCPEHAPYRRLPLPAYLEQCYLRACRFRTLYEAALPRS